MNLVSAAEEPVLWRVGLFLVTSLATVVLTVATVSASKRLADVLDALSDSRLPWKSKWTAMVRAWKAGP
jgi:hypothetical protein